MRRLATSAAALLLVVVALSGDPASAGEPDPAQPTKEAQAASLRRTVLDGLASAHPKARAAAADALVSAWPRSAPLLDEVLESKDAAVRLEAVRILLREELGDVRDRIRSRFADASAAVRVQAIRVARRLDWPEVEPDFVTFVVGDVSWPVRQEALRGLEDRGTVKCLNSVFAAWRGEREPDRRRRYRRVLTRIVGTDHVDDEEAWARAIEDAMRPKR